MTMYANPFQLNKFVTGLARTAMKAKKIWENTDKASRSNSIGISQTYKLLGDGKCGIKKGNSGKSTKNALGPNWRGFSHPFEACFLF